MKTSFRSAFTLIELAAAFAVFALILLAVGAIVQQSSDSWRSGLDAVSASDEGRAFTDEVFRDLTAAICTSNFPFVVANNGSGSSSDDKIYMISGYHRNDDGTSDICEVAYFLKPDPRNSDPDYGDRKILIRRVQNVSGNIRGSYGVGGARDTLTEINSLPFWDPSAPNDQYMSRMARNVRSFRVACFDSDNKPLPIPSGTNYDSIDNNCNPSDRNYEVCELPARVEVTLQILPDETWRRKAKGSAPSSLEDSTVEVFSIAVSPTQTAF